MNFGEICEEIASDAAGADVDCASHACAAAAMLPHSTGADESCPIKK